MTTAASGRAGGWQACAFPAGECKVPQSEESAVAGRMGGIAAPWVGIGYATGVLWIEEMALMASALTDL
jgi:hypothetical protein